MKCGQCGEPLEEGRVEVHGTPGGSVSVGWSLQDLYWYDANNRRKSRRRIIDSGQGKPAFGCKHCGLITIDTTTASSPAKRGRRFRKPKSSN